MNITAAMVKELRERTGAGMMECKRALVAADGNIDAAAEAMRKSGQAKADKKAGRVAAEGLIAFAGDANRGALVEVNCETDFVGRGDRIQAFAQAVADAALATQPVDLSALAATPVEGGMTVEDARRAIIAELGENVQVRRFVTLSGGATLANYLHGRRIGVMIALDGGDATLARNLAMHVAASNPLCVAESDVPAATLEKEREIQTEIAAKSGKPDNIVEKMVEGRLRKYLAEITLLGQAFVMDPDTSVGKLLNKEGASVAGFARYEVGEGIEKKTEDFAAEVMAQVKQSET